MLGRTLNLGIVAHVDAGKTTLTERLLYAAGVIDEVGSVDKGTTQTDTLPLEQQRGITIKAAVVSFELEDLTVNLIDTPGHPDFIAEVERVLSVLDGAVLVVSGVEGVQPQTRVLMRALRRLRIPTLVFVNKLDRAGADFERVVREISERLTPAVAVPDGGVDALVEVLAENDDELLAAYVDGGVAAERVHDALAEQSRQALVYPVLHGAAIKGVGIETVAKALSELLPASVGDPEGPLSGSIFKIERGAAGDKVAYVRMFSGTLRTRDVVGGDKVTAIAVFERGEAVRRPSVSGRQIAKVWGLHEHRIGDTVGEPPPRTPQREFAPPTLRSVVGPRDPDDANRLRLALARLAEQDPLINVRDEPERDLTVSLYGEVQQEVLEATLRDDFDLDAEFHDRVPICVERPCRRGEALEILHGESNPFNAEIGLRIEPAPADSGIAFTLDVVARDIPLYVYNSRDEFREQMERYVRGALHEGLHGWEVVDCVVTMTQCAYSIADGPPSRRGPTSTAADFRKLTPLVLSRALARGGTVICEPVVRVSLEVPTRTVGAVLPALARLGAAVEMPSPHGELSTLEAVMPVTAADELQRQLPGLTGGEGIVESSFAGYRPVSASPGSR
ncbi:MAG: TetM/TetW/TetO/TetS family tetracycline resistance ribosomal protection protein [Actinobacteria bacterium]|nr:MAG: TetM/TetW/TetO/TetS family tetracycline resistance ribosomal protection protein [Actinomycetota bacterium]